MDTSDLLEGFISNIKSSEVSPDDPLSYTSDCPSSSLKREIITKSDKPIMDQQKY